MPVTFDFKNGAMKPKANTLADILGGEHVEHYDAKKRIYASSCMCSRRNLFSTVMSSSSSRKLSFSLYTGVGESIHNIVTQRFDDKNALVFREYSLPKVKGLEIFGGRVDAIVLVAGELRILEVKTLNRREPPTEAKLFHEYQARAYSAFTGLPYTILYVPSYVSNNTFKRDVEWVDFNFSYDPDDAYHVAHNLFYSCLCIEHEVVPSVPAHFNKTLCKNTYCPFISKCWGEEYVNPDSTKTQEILLKQASVNAQKFVEDTKRRRNGALKHMCKHSTRARNLLNTEWSHLLPK